MSLDYKYKGFGFRSIYYPTTGERLYKLFLPMNRYIWFDSLQVLHKFVDELIEVVHICGY